jgi:uncharacterized protein (TIGR03083 family)
LDHLEERVAETPERLVERLRSEGQRTVEFFQALAPEQWQAQVYSDGAQWQTRHLLAHFVATENAFHLLIEDILSGGSGAPEDFDIDDFNQRRVAELKETSTQDLLAQFAAGRQASIAQVARMGQADLLRTGRHPFLGMTTLQEIIQLLYRHNQIHQRDIRKLLSAS